MKMKRKFPWKHAEKVVDLPIGRTYVDPNGGWYNSPRSVM